MINIDNHLIKKLRKCTSVGILKCKDALIRANGDIELAIDIIRKSGIETIIKKSGKTTESGMILVKLSSDRKLGVILEVKCETDFSSKNNIFQEFVKDVIVTALDESINTIDMLKVKFKKKCAYVSSQLKENVYLSKFAMLKGDFLDYYVHREKIGVIISGNCMNLELSKNIAMHIIASCPKYIDTSDVPINIIMHERLIQENIAIKYGKSGKILKKIVDGKMNKFMKKIVLTQQDFILDTKKTVGVLLHENNVKINNFVRFEINEN